MPKTNYGSPEPVVLNAATLETLTIDHAAREIVEGRLKPTRKPKP